MSGGRAAERAAALLRQAMQPRALLIQAIAAAALAFLAVSGGLAFSHALIALILVWLACAAAAPAEAQGGNRPAEPAAAATPELQDILDAAPAALVAIDSAGLVTSAGRRARETFAAVSPGQPLIYAFRDPDFIAAVEAVLGGRGPRDFPLAGAAGARTAFRVFAAPLASGGALIAFIDETAALRAEAMRSEFVANASHELRTPLASLLGFVETLQGPARDDPAAREKFLSIMNSQARRMARLIDDLLSLSRIEQRAHIRPEGEADLASLSVQILDSLGPLAKAGSVDLTLARESGGPFLVRGDRDELLRLIENLVENAIKYGAGGGKAEIKLSRGEGGIVLSVRDWGPGIAPEHLPRLTERFYRADPASSQARGGTGLGLALVKHIAARHGAKLSIESELGRGAIFSVTFPAGP